MATPALLGTPLATPSNNTQHQQSFQSTPLMVTHLSLPQTRALALSPGTEERWNQMSRELGIRSERNSDDEIDHSSLHGL